MKIELRAFGHGIFRLRAVTEDGFRESLLSRYHLIDEPSPVSVSFNAVTDDRYILAYDAGTVTLSGGKRPVTLLPSGADGASYRHHGFSLDIPLANGERFFGLGDETRELLQKRGHVAAMWIKNVVAYGPMPFLLSSDGWAIFTNTTFPHTFDIGAADPDTLRITAQDGALDIYLFAADSMKSLIAAYTSLTGRPPVLPKFAYGYLYVCNEDTDARSLLWDCRTFRKEGIPCDTMGLEPSWMSKRYDYSLDKAWNPQKFDLPSWEPANQSGPFTFFHALREMGFRFSLWLCMDYDLLYKEEADHAAVLAASSEDASYDGAEIVDAHFAGGVRMDTITRTDEPWFEHLKKFVDNGASAFKLDGSNQIIEHPDRLWAQRYLDREVHNLYPVLYARQMKEGFEAYTGRRAMIYTAGMYAGTQAYAATWAGDTGGGPKSLVSILNFAMCGHANTTCDMRVTDLMGIHCGFLLPWTQQLGWANWQYPWFLRESLEEGIRFYANLRSSLFPYLYATAYQSYETGLPIARPLPLVYEDDTRFDDAAHLYFLGDSLLVSAFDMEFPLPRGLWIDFWNDAEYAGGGMLTYTPPEGRGGALFVRPGAIFARMEPQPSIESRIPETVFLEWYPREGASGSFTLCEDDGETLAYRGGVTARTAVHAETVGHAAHLCVRPREKNGVGEQYLSRELTVRMHTPIPPRALTAADGTAIPFTRDGSVCLFRLPNAFADGFDLTASL
ncbi:MAG: glycoside hydrolase family 31 protein [Clostridiaceae bacterium]|nr:glycoside hydrolase family 31 protein [Clostridiaceae bacterium]